MLLDHKNVACINRDTMSQIYIQSHLDEDVQRLMQLVIETFGHCEKDIFFEKNSPFVRVADKILIRLLESGLIVLATGHGLSMVIFMTELLRDYIKTLASRCPADIIPGSLL